MKTTFAQDKALTDFTILTYKDMGIFDKMGFKRVVYSFDEQTEQGDIQVYDINEKFWHWIEIKEDFAEIKYGSFLIEYSNFEGKPKGITTATAKYHMLIHHLRGEIIFQLIPTEDIREMIKNKEYIRKIDPTKDGWKPGGAKGSHCYRFDGDELLKHGRIFHRMSETKEFNPKYIKEENHG